MRPPSTITKIHQDILCLLWAFILNATNINPQFASFANSIRSVDYLPTVSDWTPTASRQHFQTLTQFDVSVQHEQDVPGLQVSVDDLHFVQVVQSLQHLASHHFNLRLRQSTIQLWPRDEGVKKKKKKRRKEQWVRELRAFKHITHSVHIPYWAHTLQPLQNKVSGTDLMCEPRKRKTGEGEPARISAKSQR